MDVKSNLSTLQSLIGGADLARQQDQARQREIALQDEARRQQQSQTADQSKNSAARGRLSSADELAQARANAKQASEVPQRTSAQAQSRQSVSTSAQAGIEAFKSQSDQARFLREAPFGRSDTSKPAFRKLGQIVDILV